MFYYIGPWRLVDRPMGPRWEAPEGTVGRIDLARREDHGIKAQERRIGFFATDRTLDTSYVLLGSGDLRELPTTGFMQDQFQSLLGYRPTGHTLLHLLRDTLLAGDPRGWDRSKPLLPTQRGFLEIHLGGHGRVHREAFKWGHPHTNQVQSVLHVDWYGRLLQLQNGQLTQRNAQKVLGGLVRQYKSPWRELLPQGMHADLGGPLKPETAIQDTFNRADSSTLGTSSDGLFTWDEYDAGLAIVSNTVQPDFGVFGAAQASFDFASDNLFVQCELRTQDNNVNVISGVTARHQVSALEYYQATVIISGGLWTFEIDKIFAGITALSSSAGNTETVTKYLYLSCNGSSLVNTYGGTEYNTATDTDITGHLRTGLVMQAFLGLKGTFDNFGAEDIASGQPAIRRHGMTEYGAWPSSRPGELHY